MDPIYAAAMKKLFLLIVLLPFPVSAATPKQGFEAMYRCMKQQAATCAQHFTPGSQELFKKIIDYDMARCIPADAVFVSDIASGASRVVRARFTEDKANYVARMAFSQDAKIWKMDLPETLRQAFGERWLPYTGAIEKAYVIVQKQMNGSPGCDVVKLLLQPRPQKI
jgi:hypothetical protein